MGDANLDFSNRGKALDFSDRGVPLEKTMDKNRGAPYGVRRAVGGAPESDRLATIRNFFPDAQPYEDGNFVFTDPQTGRPTLYNPGGMDMGDIGSIQPEIAEFGGGFLGGALAAPGALIAAPVTGGASLLGIPAGVGLGASIGREAENIYMTNAEGRVDTRGGTERVSDAAMTAGVNALGQRAGDLAISGARNLIGKYGPRMFTRGTPGDTNAAFARLGVTAKPAGAVSGSKTIQSIEHGLYNTPGGTGKIQGVVEDTVSQLGRAAQETANLARQARPSGTALSRQQAGLVAQTAAKEASKRFGARVGVLDTELEAAVGGATKTKLPNILALRDTLAARAAQADKSLKPTYGRALTEIDKLLRDAYKQGGTIPFGALREIRTRIGRELDNPDASGWRPGDQKAMAQLYGALKADIKAAAWNSGPKGYKALEKIDRYVRFNRTQNLPALQAVVDAGLPEQAWNLLQSGQRTGGSMLMKLRRSMKGEEWDEVVSTTLARMGDATPGQQGMPTEIFGQSDTFSPSTFLTNFSKLSPEAKMALFAGTRYRRLKEPLQDLARATAAMKDSEKMANTSGTARSLLYGTLAGSLGTAAGTGRLGTAAAVAIGPVVPPYIAARLLESPGFVRWLATGMRMVGNNPNALNRHLARLAVVTEAEPQFEDAIDQYQDALRKAVPAS